MACGENSGKSTFLDNPLDKAVEKRYNMRVALREGDGPQRHFEKTFLKKVKKGIDKGKVLWYNIQAVREKGQRAIIENWTTKEIVQSIAKCEIQISSIELYILNKVKEAKKE